MNVRSSALLSVVVSAMVAGSAFAGGGWYADTLISYDPGSGAAGGYTNPLVALGSPERYTGEGIFPGVVSPFNPPWGTDEIVSIGAGGHLTVRFAAPILNDPNNPWGIDFIIFSNTGFIDTDFPHGIVGGLFGNDGGIIEVSANGVDWFTITGVDANGLYPTLGYLDSGPFDTEPGTILSDFTRPVNPAYTMNDFLGKSHAEVVAMYDGSGGGTPVDIASTGLAFIHYIRISNPIGAAASVEIDGFARVQAIPAPGAFGLLAGLTLVFRRRRRTA